MSAVTIRNFALLDRWHVRGAVLIAVAAFGLGGAGVALGAAPATSHGTSAASDQYDRPATNVAGQTAGKPSSGSLTPPSVSTSSGGTLPFTGVSLIWSAVAAVGLVGLGLGLRRYERKS